MSASAHAPAKTPVRAVDPGDRFSQRSGPVKVLVKDGKILNEPEIVQVTGAEAEFSPYILSKRKKGSV